MFKLRLGWYAGVSTALAGAVVISAFHQRANFYSAMVYLAQSNFCLLVLVNFTLLLYSSFIYALTQICFGTLRAVEVEQLTERAWFAITETCLAMTIFRDEIGAWFLVMFTALVTGKVWGWIGDGRVEFLEQQPPPNPRLFHLRLSTSLAASFIYDIWILRYTVNAVIQQARPNMMVMFLFEFAVLGTCSWRTAARYVLSLAEQSIIKAQTKKRLLERRQEVREEREAMVRQREQAAAAGEEAPENQEPLPNPDDIDEMDIEVPGWASKGELVLWLDLVTDMLKLGIYVAFFLVLLRFYGLPIHIMRDLFMTTRDFLKRLQALLRYRRAILEMNKYPDATAEDLAQENTCIICREEMHHWDPVHNSGAVDRVRPKKLPCNHILHLGCLKSWLERQQVCPTCRSPVTGDRARNANGNAPRRAGLGIQFGGAAQQQPQGNRPANNRADNNNGLPGDNDQNGGGVQPPAGQPRVFTFGPIRLGFGANGQQVRELAQQFGMPPVAGEDGQVPATPAPQSQSQAPVSGDSLQQVGNLLREAEQMIQREMQGLQSAHQELQVAHLLNSELQRLRQRRQQPQDATQTAQGLPPPPLAFPQPPPLPMTQPPQFPIHLQHQIPPLAGLPPFPPLLAGNPPRLNSPLMTRHGVSPFSTAIPAGSPDLPDGVVLPPGWSLTPLQRLDGTSQLSPQTTIPPQGVETASSGQQAMAPLQPTPTTSLGHESHPAESSPLRVGLDDALSSRPDPVTQQPIPSIPEPPPVVSPSPVMPNWGGSAQLFGGGSRLDRVATATRNGSQESAPTTEQIKTEPSTSKEQDEQGGISSNTQQQDGSSDKGKGKAVTVEEAEDDD